MDNSAIDNNTKVTDLLTGREIWYSCPPQEAVVCAYEQYTRNNWNTWDYDYGKAMLSISRNTWACGNFTAQAH